ncbi:MAG TPA: DNA polymerase III subunit epsilon [Methylibium sp.]|uniref:DNA polymerase III subunit epsilon n=1 Tax=Methylibium sp. TaxID=2067992 RepID=UPI002DBA9932|nr:DNA polymerase III subunit epsilon [Methylibium sp.]HEU4459916.1 DNA polymerase III subunit epsilon [Methylibium sp.]
MSRIVFLDTETTGLSPDNGDRIVEIGCVEMVNRRLTGETLHHYLNPERASHEDALKVHGLTDEFLAGQPRFAEVADALLDFLAGAEIVIHNAAFDIGFLDAELKRLGRPGLASQAKVSCSLTMARELYPGKSNSLDALCKRLEVDNTARTLHGALLDAGLLAEVYLRMTRGQNSLVIEVADGTRRDDEPSLAVVDLAAFELAVVEPDADELSAHEAALADLDKASKGRTLWRAVAYSAASSATL